MKGYPITFAVFDLWEVTHWVQLHSRGESCTTRWGSLGAILETAYHNTDFQAMAIKALEWPS